MSDTKKIDILPDSAYVLGDLSPEELKQRVENEKNCPITKRTASPTRTP